ncbi:hypothetical protein PhCBS80983_g03965 [Powellomyces hirtus]|uniref:Arrestin C-terminal-like domain-containing protein n=1 Tax=Powellomyces hirtus TaxID=109895 RepID=A0A507E1K4_9FUNG|nr:hypothetical protein PhCBS80983_g03965 [Powellomyces hirtus]
MKEPTLELIPLDDRDSFVDGKYGLQPCSLRGILRITQPFRNPLHLVDASVSFSGTSVSTAEEVDLIDCHSSVLPDEHDCQLQPGVHNFEWVVELPLDPPLPPSRKVVSTLAYHRKLHRIKYRLLANLCWHGMVGKVRKEVVIPIEPFLVWPGESGEMATLLKPAPFRWDSITSVVQYDLSVSTTILGPGDSFDLQFRVVPRGYICENVKVKLTEFCDDVAVLPSNGSGVHNGAGRRKLLSWDWKSTSPNEMDDFFHVQQHRLTLPADPRPNPSTLLSEIHPTAAIRHQLDIAILFDDAPAIRLECPITILSVPIDQARCALEAAFEDQKPNQQKSTIRRNGKEGWAANDIGGAETSVVNSEVQAGPRTSSLAEPIPEAVRKATTIKKRDTVVPAKRVTTLNSSAPAPPLPNQDVRDALSAMQDTLIKQSQQQHEELLSKLANMEVEQKRLVRRIFQLEALVKNSSLNGSDHETENELSLRSSASTTNLQQYALNMHNQAVRIQDDNRSINGKQKGLRGMLNKSFGDIRKPR